MDNQFKKAKDLTDQELVAYSGEHLFYEIEMLINSSGWNNPNQHQLLDNIRIEIFAIHLRCLINFFYPYPDKIKENDVLAKHFFTDPSEWDSTRTELNTELRKARTRINREMAHLTTARLGGNSNLLKFWNIETLRTEILSIIKKFCEKADKNKLDKSIITLLESN